MIENLTSNPLSANTKQESGLIRAVVVRELDNEGAYLLKTQSGREFAVRTDAGAGLTAGQNVLVNQSEGKIIVISDNGSAGQPQLLKQLTADLFCKSEQPPQSENGANQTNTQANPKSGDFVISPGKNFADGIYKINSAEIRELVDKVLREISGRMKDYSAVRFNSVNGQQIVSVVTGENLQKVIEEILSNFTSGALRSLPVAFFEQLFTERGELNFDVLKTLDALLQNRNLPIDTASAVQLEKLDQWIRLIIDNPQMIEKLAVRIPVTETREVARQFQTVNAMSANFLPDVVKGSLSPENFFLTEDKLSAAGLNRGALVENLCASAFSSAPLILLEVLEKSDSFGQAAVIQTATPEARQIVSEFLSKFPSLAYKELEMIHDSNRLPPKISDPQTQPTAPPREQSPQQPPAPQILIRAALSELTETAVKTLLDGNAKEAAEVINTKIASLKETISQMLPPKNETAPVSNVGVNEAESREKPVQNETKPELSNNQSNKLNNTEKTEKVIQNVIKPDVLINIADKLEKAVSSFSAGLNKSELDFGEKAALLKIIQTSVSSLNSALPPLNAQTYPVSQNFYERLVSMPKLQNDSTDTNALFSRITAAQESIQRLTHRLTNDINSLDDKGAGKELLNLTHKMWSETEKLRAGFQEVFSSLDLQNRISVLESSNERLLFANSQSIESFRLDLMVNVSRALQEIFSSIKELNAAASQIPENLRLTPEIETVLRSVVQNLEQQTHQSTELLTDKLKIALRELTSMQAENTKAAEQHNTKSTDGKTESAPQNALSNFTGADVLRSAVQNAARGLETLQLLSAQTRGAGETQQQIIALPVKIGEEWTEVYVKFLKEKTNSKKKTGGGHVSVYLNVAPSALGEVGAHLDFHPPANLKVSFTFERTETKKWFIGQSTQIREALSEAGLPGTALEFRSKRIQKMNDSGISGRDKSRRKSDKGKIDIDA